MRKIVLSIVVFLTALALFVLRPWSDYSPLAMDSLFHPDKRVENMRNMHRIFPYRQIHAGNTRFNFADTNGSLEVTYTFDGEQRQLQDFLQRVDGTGLLVIQGDRILHEQYRLGADEDSLFTSWSVAKSFVATLIGMALYEGRIQSLDDAVTDYVPELTGSAWEGVSIRHVLQMSSGVEFDETYANKRSDINKFFWKLFVFGRRADDVLHDYEPGDEPGLLFHYVSMETQVLSQLLRKVYATPLTTVMQERIWRPLGMEADAYWNIDEDSEAGVELGFCCLNATLRDYAKLGRLYLNQGDWNGRQLLPPGWVEEATRPAEPWLQAEQTGYQQRGYQYQWWSPPQPEGEYFASGVWGQYIYVSEPDELIIVRTSVDPDFNPNMLETMTVFRAIRDHLREQLEQDKQPAS